MITSSFNNSSCFKNETKMGETYDYLFKIILVGDPAVGKTSLVRRFTTGRFQQEYKSTIGVDFTVQTLQLDGKIVKLQIWDTTGQERFRSLTTGYYRNAHAALVVYDVTNTESLHNCVRWMNDVSMYSGQDIPKLLLGNKCDKLSGRTVSSSDGEHFARKHNMMSFSETSAKDGRNVDDAFYKLAQELSRTYFDSMDYRSDSIRLDSIPDNTASWWGCCGY
ncbi:ras-related protein Rab-10-like [Mytilus edulis]|uniref:ras-related protein Rab-10-like n=1 Tax=Mytilus edulis TaxID=6550 RepID=UPI0039EFAA42